MLENVLKELSDSKKESIQIQKESIQIQKESVQFQKDMFRERLEIQARHNEDLTRLKINNVHILANLERLQRAHDVRGALGMSNLRWKYCNLYIH